MNNPRQSPQLNPKKVHFKVNLITITWLFLIILLLGCASFLSTEQTAETSSLDSPTPTETQPTSTAQPTSIPTTNQVLNDNLSSTPTTAQSQTSDSLIMPQATLNPKIGEITFALGVTDDYTPLEADIFFTYGITEVHAIFEYSGITTNETWERVWYLNDKEVARVTDKWVGPEAGTFDYFIDNSDRPLPAGDWMLELYVQDKLQALGIFIIDEPQAEVAVANQKANLLAYTKCDGDHHDIYVADINGNNERLMVKRGGGPSWTPGGGTLFFGGEAGVDRQVRDGIEYVFDGISDGVVAMSASPLPNGINNLNLFQYLEWKQSTVRWASVSPDGSMVAFDAKPGGDYRIYFLGNAKNQQYQYEIIGEQADWSPDSQKLVYRSGRNGQIGIWVSNRDDTGHTRLTEHGSDSFPVWSPDGKSIAFSHDEAGNVDIYTMNIDGSNLRRLTTAAGHDTLPTYAPTGKIIFRSARNDKWDIWKMGSDGSNQIEIISNACVGHDWAFSKMDVIQ